MKYSIVVTHQGWTDLIVCLGLIFSLAKVKEKIVLLIRKDAEDFIDFLFKDNNKIIIEYLPKFKLDRKQIKGLCKKKYKECEFLGIGAFWTKDYGKIFNPGSVEYFYKPLGLEYDCYFKDFNLTRNKELEEIRYKSYLEIYGENYIIINEDNGRNLNIDRKYLNKDYSIININGRSKVLFDMILLIENAKEIHLISTFWSFLIKILQKRYNLFEGIPIYFHDYVRDGYYQFLYKDTDWKFITTS